VFAAIGDPGRVLDHTRALHSQGRTQLALHVIDLVALAPGDSPEIAEARALKATLLRARSAQMTSAVSRQILLSEAELLMGLEIGALDTAPGEEKFEWK